MGKSESEGEKEVGLLPFNIRLNPPSSPMYIYATSITLHKPNKQGIRRLIKKKTR